MLVEYVHGDFLNVVGFPLNHFCKKLAELYYPPPKHTIHHIKYDSIPSVETFEILSDGECDSSENSQSKDAKNLKSNAVAHSQGKHNSSHHKHNVPVDNQNGVIENATQFPSKLVQLLDGFKASKVTCSFVHGYVQTFLPIQRIKSLLPALTFKDKKGNLKSRIYRAIALLLFMQHCQLMK